MLVEPDLVLGHPMLQVDLLGRQCLVLAFICQLVVVELVPVHHLSTGDHQSPQITNLKEDSVYYHQFSDRLPVISGALLIIVAQVLVHLEHHQLHLHRAEAPD